MKPRSFRPRSTPAQTTCTSGYVACTFSIPSGAATRQTSVTERAPASFTVPIAATLELPVASIGSSTIASRSSRSSGSFDVVLNRLERLLVPVHPHEPDPRARDQRERSLEHADARAQHGADGDLLAGDPLGLHRLERSLDLDRLGGKVLRRLVGEEQRELVDELAEVDGRSVLVSKIGQLVLDERVQHHRKPRPHGGVRRDAHTGKTF